MTAAESIFDSLLPADLGLPLKFDRFRLPQRQALGWLNEDCMQPLSAACLPTGAGKTAIAVALAKLLGVKAVYLVATKALQAQVLGDFATAGMTDIRGRANYPCENYGNCEAGWEEDCSIRQTTACPYTKALDRAKHADLVVTNYAYWMHARKANASALELELGPEIGLLICDEAHALESQLTGFASIKIYSGEIGRLVFPRDGVMQQDVEPTTQWQEWARAKLTEFEGTTDDEEKEFVDKCRRILRMGTNWVWQFDDRGHCTFEPIRLSGFTSRLFAGISRTLLMSASLNEFTLRLLLPADAAFDYRAWGAVFPPQNAPVYHIPCRKLNWKSTDEDYKAVIELADSIISNRLDRKGIIHTVSYARSKKALQHSRFRDRFIFNEDSSGLGSALTTFRGATGGTILVTPSVSAGFDFSGSQAEYQIILKFPFPNETQRVIKERCRQIPGYRLWAAGQEIVQMCGRARRYAEDRCETFILDNAIRQLCGPEGRSYCPAGFKIFTVASVPPAPPKIVD